MTINAHMPNNKYPVFIIGAGSIVNNAHLPAYQLAGFNVQGIVDIDIEKARVTADKFGIPTVFANLDDMLQHATTDTIFDLAVPGSAMIEILEKLPVKSTVLLQKPMGENFEEAKKILEIARTNQMIAAVNFQLRYAPFIAELRDMLQQGLLGELLDIEVNVNVYTPWHIWDFLFTSARVEILYHSIHYIDMIRSFLGNPASIYAKTVKHPAMKELASVRSNIIMDYGEMIRANILTNHCHDYGKGRQHSYMKFEGSKGAVKISFGVLKNYPDGETDKFEYILKENGKNKTWKKKDINGSWFPHAFIGSMAQVMLAKEGVIESPDNSVEDCIHTMACVEAAYQSSQQGGIRPAY
ncbi:MAG: Gfo/Idh/MocA family oxidoreductase [Ferruginibacter sp.]